MNAATGTLTLSGNNSGAAGGVTLTTGTLNINNANALGSGLVTLTAGTINNTSGAAIVNAGNNAVTWGGDLAYGTAGNTSLNSLNLGSGVVTTSTSRALTFAGTGNTLTMGALNITAPTSTGRVITVSGAGNTLNMGGLTLTANPSQAVTVELAGTANIGVTGPILNSSVTTAFANGVKVSATGTTTFSGVNAYSGSTAVAKTATLNIPIGGSLANCGPIVVAGTGTSAGNSANLNLAGAAGVVQVGLNGYVRGGGSITSLQVQYNATTSGTVEVALGSTWTTGGTIDFAAGSRVLVTGTPVSGQTYTLMTATADITGSTPTLMPTANVVGWALRVTGRSIYLEEVGVVNLASGQTTTYSVANFITGALPLTKRGEGTLVLSASNDYTAGTSLEAGTLQIENATALGSGAVYLKGGILKSTVNLDLAKSTFTTTVVGAGNMAYQDAYGAISNFVKYTGNNTTISGPVTLDVASGTTMTMVTLVGNSDANSLVTKIGAGTVQVLGGSTKVSGAALATNGNGSTVLGGWRIREGTVWFSPSSNNGGGNGPITLAGGSAKFTKLQNSNGTFTGFEVPSDLTVENDGLIQYDPDASTLPGQNTLGFNNLTIGSRILEVATASSPGVGQSLPRVNFKSGILTGSATFKNSTALDLALQAISGTGGFTKTGLGTLYLSDQPNQAAAFATLTSSTTPTTVESINVEYAGSGYTAAPAVTLVGGGATTQATAQAMIDSKGRVTSIAVLTPGVGYTSLPRVVIAAPPTVATANSYTGATSVETGKLNLNGSYASSVTVKSAATLELDWLTPAEARCSIDQVSSKSTDYNANAANAVVKDLFLTKSVGGYTPNSTLTLTIEAPRKTDGTTLVSGGVAATATATVNSQGVISALSIVTGGSGYVISPRVTVPAPTEPTVVARTTGSITFNPGAKLALNIASPTSASYTLLTADGGISGDPQLETSIPGYALTKSPDGKSLILQNTKTTPTITVTPAVGGYIYSASYQGPGLSELDKGGSTGGVTLSYSGTGSTTYGPSVTPPTNAGNYTLTATVAADSNYNEASSAPTAFTIAKATPTVSVPPTASAVTVGAQLSTSNLIGGTASVPGTFAWTTLSTVVNATASYAVTFTPNDGSNYNTASTSASVTANPAGTTYSDWLSANGGIASDAAFLDYVFGAATPGALPASLKPTVAVTSGNLVLTYYVRQGTVGLTVTAQTSADLATGVAGWGTSGVTDVPVGEPTTAANGVRVQQRTASVSASSGKKFLRIQAVQAAP
jgi:autotransporter-associated beta strand protein